MVDIRNKPTLTIFTPTFNRGYTLHKCYESLKRQTCKDFVWLIIDDGSTDNTRELVEEWKKENKISIIYFYQENLGMHGAHNTAYDLIDTELNMCIDSDDYLSDEAVEKILKFWIQHGSVKYAGIVGLDAYQDGNLIGSLLPDNVKQSTLTDLYEIYGVKGDKKLVYRTDVIKKVPPYPIYSGEKYCPLSYKYMLIDQEFPLLILNEILCYVEYLQDGSSLNMLKQYKKNPRGFSFFRKTAIELSPTFKGRFRESIHFVSSNLLHKNFYFLLESPKKLTTFFAIPFGILLFLFIQYVNRTTMQEN